MKPTEPRTPTIQVLERTFALLDVLASQHDPVSLKQISEQTGLHPSTAHRILNDLAASVLRAVAVAAKRCGRQAST